MADSTTITVASYEQIATILSKLLTNYSNIALKYYDIFYNATPMDVQIQLYNETGDITTYTIPNRAKDFRYVRNGSGSPEGAVTAPVGTIYQDTTNGYLYIKRTGTDTIGWVKASANDELITYPGNPEGLLEAGKAVLCIDTANAGLYIKTTSTGNTGWVLISANTDSLADKDLSNLTSTGEAHFANPSLSNLNATGTAVLASKENISNKSTLLTSSSTDTQYPSAKAAYTYANSAVSTGTANLANKDLGNLTSTGNNKFANPSLGNLSTAGETHFDSRYSLKDLSNVTGLTASIAELNYCDGVTSNIQTQLDSKVSRTSDIYLKTAYVSGTSGYNIWSNGYCEQWGQITMNGYGSVNTVSLTKTFANTDYQVLLSWTYETTQGDHGSTAAYRVNGKAVSSFIIFSCFENYNPIVTWRVLGYLAEGQY